MKLVPLILLFFSSVKLMASVPVVLIDDSQLISLWKYSEVLIVSKSEKALLKAQPTTIDPGRFQSTSELEEGWMDRLGASDGVWLRVNIRNPSSKAKIVYFAPNLPSVSMSITLFDALNKQYETIFSKGYSEAFTGSPSPKITITTTRGLELGVPANSEGIY